MKKQLNTLILLIILVGVSVSAQSPSPTEEPTYEETTTPAPTPQPTVEETPSPEPTETPTEEPTVEETPTTTPIPSPSPGSVEEVIYEIIRNPSAAYRWLASNPSSSPIPYSTASPVQTPSNTPSQSPSPVTSPETCEEAYGGGYTTCPTDVEKGSEGYAECCGEDEDCCHKIKSYKNEYGETIEVDPVCCSTKTKGGWPLTHRIQVCESVDWEIDGARRVFNYCRIDDCLPPRSQHCDSTTKKVCCLPEPQEYCGKQTGGLDSAFCALKLDNDEDCPPGKFECYRQSSIGKDEVLCCKDGTAGDGRETCEYYPFGGKKYCNSQECAPGETLCQGKDDQAWRKICCISGEACFHHANGYPKCVKI
jgi:hypothetical protein